ncbi:MAG: 6-carboxyhexanoate--CoA ligase [Aquificae bacterium]|nr:6-carboxyhexanoate--CoA ligase [Aquificota bacterium]
MFYSIKIRASKEGKHLSGAERIVKEELLNITIDELYSRVKRKKPDFISLKIKKLKKKPSVIPFSLEIKNLFFNSYIEANKEAIKILTDITGIKEKKLKNLIQLLHTGASPNRENMRGAMIVNQDGERIEIDKFRGIRTTDVDFEDRKKMLEFLHKKGYTERTLDALALTTKNMLYPDIIAEYCISDEPDYTTGYISTKNFYYRFSPLKEAGNSKGGRIYFVKNDVNLEKLYDFLQHRPILISF